MPIDITPDLIAGALTGLFFLLSGIGIYARTKPGPVLNADAYRIETPRIDSSKQLERIAQALEDIASQGKDSFQKDTRDKLEKIEEVMEAFERSRGRDRDDDRETFRARDRDDDNRDRHRHVSDRPNR